MANRIRRFFVLADKMVEGVAIGLLVFLILNVVVGVVMRRVLGQMFPWSEEISLLCLTWFSFMGIAIGFRENLHLGMDLLDHYLPAKVLAVWDKAMDGVAILFGIYLTYYGTIFTRNMAGSTLAVTGWPNAVQYVVIPITGLLTVVYSILRLLGHDLRRYRDIGEEIKKDG